MGDLKRSYLSEIVIKTGRGLEQIPNLEKTAERQVRIGFVYAVRAFSFHK